MSLFSSLAHLPPFCLSSSLYLLSLRRTHSFKLISHEPSLIVWSQSPHAAAMATGGVHSCSKRKFNTSSDDISRTKWVFARVHLIYLTDLYPSQKATGVRNSVISAFWQNVLYERYRMRKWEIPTDPVHLYVNLSASSPKGYRICQWLEVFMSAVCLYLSVASNWTSLRSGWCPCLCQTSVSEESVMTGSERCLIVRCLFLSRKEEIGWHFCFVSYKPE